MKRIENNIVETTQNQGKTIYNLLFMNFHTSFRNVEMLQSWKNNLKYFANFPKIIILFVVITLFRVNQTAAHY